MNWLDVTDDIPIEVEVGQVLGFDFEGSKTYLKIMRKRNGKVWAKETTLYTPEEFAQKVKKVKKVGVNEKRRKNRTADR